MTYTKVVVLVFFNARKAGNAIFLAQCVELGCTTGQQLMCICLMAHVPDQLVRSDIVRLEQGQSQFDDAKGWSKVSAMGGNRTDDGVAKLLGQYLKLLH